MQKGLRNQGFQMCNVRVGSFCLSLISHPSLLGKLYLLYFQSHLCSVFPLFSRLELTEVEELDLPEDPCNPDPDYNFQAGCRQCRLVP